MDTRSGELLSAGISVAMSISLLLNDNSAMAQYMSNYLPEWAILAILCSLFCLITNWVGSVSWQRLSRFLSGCIWGTVFLVYLSQEQFGAIFAASIVLFTYDILTVITKGRFSWMQKNTSSIRE